MSNQLLNKSEEKNDSWVYFAKKKEKKTTYTIFNADTHFYTSLKTKILFFFLF